VLGFYRDAGSSLEILGAVGRGESLILRGETFGASRHPEDDRSLAGFPQASGRDSELFSLYPAHLAGKDSTVQCASVRQGRTEVTFREVARET
jgi:hypothetical protein